MASPCSAAQRSDSADGGRSFPGHLNSLQRPRSGRRGAAGGRNPESGRAPHPDVAADPRRERSGCPGFSRDAARASVPARKGGAPPQLAALRGGYLLCSAHNLQSSLVFPPPHTHTQLIAARGFPACKTELLDVQPAREKKPLKTKLTSPKRICIVKNSATAALTPEAGGSRVCVCGGITPEQRSQTAQRIGR